MIFVECSVQDWRKKYPTLDVIEGVCDGCHSKILANRPFVTDGYAGLRAGVCPCGQGRHTVMSLVTTSVKKHGEWCEVVLSQPTYTSP